MFFFQCECSRPYVIWIVVFMGGDQNGSSIFLKIEYSNKQHVLIPKSAITYCQRRLHQKLREILVWHFKVTSHGGNQFKNDGHKRPLLVKKN